MKKKSVKPVTEDKKIIGVILIFIILIIGGIILTNLEIDNDNISKVTKVLANKYDSIKCVNAKCDGVVVSTTENKKTVNKIYNVYGKLVAKYTVNDKEKNKKIPYNFSKNYILMQKKISDDKSKYYVTNTDGKVLYETENKLLVLNEEYVIMQESANIDYVYTIINSKGKVVYDNITEYQIFDDNNFVYIKKEDKNYLLNTKMEKAVKDCKVQEEVKNEDDETEYLILKNTKNDSYYYFNTSKGLIVGDSFESYDKKSDNTLVVYKKENNKKVSYSVSKSGKQKKVSSSKFMSEVVKDIKTKLDDSKYYIYTISVMDEKQENIFVDNKEDKSFGIYNLKDNKYTSIYKYNSDKFYSTISVLDSENDETYFQISCGSPICSQTQMLVYNFSDSKELFKLSGTSLVATNYIQYKNGYKVVKYSYQSENQDYKGKYVLYDKDNKELYKSSKEIDVIDSEIVMGKVSDESIILYLSSKNKVLNDENTLANKLDIENKNYYKYQNANKKNVIINSKGKEIYSIENSGTIEYSNDNIFTISNKNIKIYNIDNDKVNTYRFSDDEVATDYFGNKIAPFAGVAFVSNNEDDYIKIIDSYGSILKQIKKSNIYKVEVNEEHNKAFIITSQKVNGKTKFGLYIAK